MALSVVGTPACDAPQDSPAGPTTRTGSATATAALETAPRESSLQNPRTPTQVEPPGSGSALAIDGGSATEELPADELRALLGCWQTVDGDERWSFKQKGARGIEVVRESKYVDATRAREPHTLWYQASSDSCSFTGAGRIHAVAFTFQRKGAELQARSYSSRSPKERFHSTGNTLSLRRCPTR